MATEYDPVKVMEQLLLNKSWGKYDNYIHDM